MMPGAIYRTESISKPVTAWGVMRLVEQGELHLDDPVLDHVTSWRPPAAVSTMSDITIRQLLSHSSGLALGSIGVHYPPTGEVPALRDNLTHEVDLPGEPGSAFHYSNPGFNLLEVLIEDVTGQDFDDYMRREVLDPLGMDHSRFAWTRAIGAAAPRGHTLDGSAVDEYVYPENASGGLRATIDDLGRFVAAGMPGHNQASTHVLRAESIRELYTPTVDMAGIYRAVSEAHGLGYFIETLPKGRRAVFYGGQGDGWLTHLHAVPETGAGLVVLTNSQRSWPLIAHVVTDWAEWSQGSRLGMSRILTATIALWALIGLLATFAVARGGRVIRELTTGRRRVEPGASTARLRRFAAGVAALTIVAALLWAISQDSICSSPPSSRSRRRGWGARSWLPPRSWRFRRWHQPVKLEQVPSRCVSPPHRSRGSRAVLAGTSHTASRPPYVGVPGPPQHLGTETDRGDAKVLTDLVRTDRHDHRSVVADDRLARARYVLIPSHQALIWTPQRWHGLVDASRRRSVSGGTWCRGGRLMTECPMVCACSDPSASPCGSAR
jgi:CubicO group peptidase (beta-lactamase class C family)